MKLRLPKALLYTLLSAVVAHPAVSRADYVWQGGDTITSDLWATEDSWLLTGESSWTTGTAPQYPSGDMWDTIVINGASGSVADLEGWNFKLNLGVTVDGTGTKTVADASTLTVENIRKLQGGVNGGYCEINIGTGSTLNLSQGISNAGTCRGTVNINFVDGGTVNLNMGERHNFNASNNLTINYGIISDTTPTSVGVFNMASTEEGVPRSLDSLTLTATITDSAVSDTTALHTIQLGNISSDINSTLSFDITADGYISSTGVLSATDADIGKYGFERRSLRCKNGQRCSHHFFECTDRLASRHSGRHGFCIRCFGELSNT